MLRHCKFVETQIYIFIGRGKMPIKYSKLYAAALSTLLFATIGSTSCKVRKSSDPSKVSSVSEAESACIFGLGNNRFGSPGASDLDLNIWQIINSSAIASRLAYSDEPVFNKQAKSLGFDRSDTITSGSMSAVVMSNKRCVVLAFRGTDMNSMRDWFVDLRATTDPVKYGRVHKGFYRAWRGLRDDVVKSLRSHGADDKTFWVTGHSLGGALAGLYAYTETFERLIFKGPRIARVVTFGQPIFGNDEVSNVMRKEFLGRYFRVVNGLDIVATVPFWLKHFGSLVWFHDDRVEYRPDTQLFGGANAGSVAAAEIPQELTPTEESLREFIELTRGASASSSGNSVGAMGWPRRISDHFMKGYLDRLQLEISDLTQ
jgi:triacylglycerol lipase